MYTNHIYLDSGVTIGLLDCGYCLHFLYPRIQPSLASCSKLRVLYENHIKKFMDIPASITISHLPRLWRFTLLLYILEHISLTLNFKHFWNLPLHSLYHFLLNHTKYNLKAFTRFGPIPNSSSPFLLLRIYGNSKGRVL